METVQLSLGDTLYAAQLREMLASGGSREVRCVDAPDATQEGVIVVDPDGLNRLPFPLRHPERVVLITHNDPQHLSQAWNAGIRSVVFDGEPLSTAVLAIMAAELRVTKPEPHWGARDLAGMPDACDVCGARTKCGEGPPIGSGVRNSRPRERRG